MDHTRHTGIYNIPPGFSVTLIGAGGIGATTALALAKMGVRNMVIYDDDEVNSLNLPTQLHMISDVGQRKTLSLARTLQLYSDELELTAIPHRVCEDTELRSSLVVSAVDSITARQAIWKALNSERSGWQFYIDARMAAEEFQMFVVRKDEADAMAAYEAHLMGMDENSVEELPCTMKATFFCAMVSAGLIGASVRNIVRAEEKSRRLIFYIPQSIIYNFNLSHV